MLTPLSRALRALPLRQALCTAALTLPLIGCSTLHSIGHVFDRDATPAAPTPANATTAQRPVAVPANAVAPSGAPGAVPPVPESSPGETVERRLATLERLHKKGLISDQEYQQKRQAVLDGL